MKNRNLKSRSMVVWLLTVFMTMLMILSSVPVNGMVTVLQERTQPGDLKIPTEAGAEEVLPNPENNNNDLEQINTLIQEEENVLITEKQEEFYKEKIDPLEVPEIIDYQEAVTLGHKERLRISEDSLYSVVFRNEDGTNTQYTFTQPVKYETSDGKVKDKRLSLKNTSLNDKDAFTVTDSDISPIFAKDTAEGAVLNSDTMALTLKPQNDFIEKTAELKSVQTEKKEDIKSKSVEKDTKSVKHSNQYAKGLTIEYKPLYTGFETNIIINENIGRNIFTFAFETDQQAVENDGIITLLNQNEEQEAEITSAYISDAKGNSLPVEVTLETNSDGGGYSLSYTVDEGFIENPETVYPLTIVYAVTQTAISGQEVGLTICSGENWYGDSYVTTSPNIRIGKEMYKDYRTFFKIPKLHPSLKNNRSLITSADIRVQNSNIQDVMLWMHTSTLNWNETNPAADIYSTWNGYWNIGTAPEYFSISAGRTLYNITDWIKDTKYNLDYGFNLRAHGFSGIIYREALAANTYFRMSYTPADDMVVLPSTTYHINNVKTHMFLSTTSNSFSPSSLLSQGVTQQYYNTSAYSQHFLISPTADGYYHIKRSMQDGEYFLTLTNPASGVYDTTFVLNNNHDVNARWLITEVQGTTNQYHISSAKSSVLKLTMLGTFGDYTGDSLNVEASVLGSSDYMKWYITKRSLYVPATSGVVKTASATTHPSGYTTAHIGSRFYFYGEYLPSNATANSWEDSFIEEQSSIIGLDAYGSVYCRGVGNTVIHTKSEILGLNARTTLIVENGALLESHSYVFENTNTNMLMTMPPNESNATIVRQDNNSDPLNRVENENQWVVHVQNNSNGTFTLHSDNSRNPNTGKYERAFYANGNTLITTKDWNEKTRDLRYFWVIERAAADIYKIKNVATQQYLYVGSNSHQSGAYISCGGNDQQPTRFWTIYTHNNFKHVTEVKGSNLYLSVSDSREDVFSTNNNATVKKLKYISSNPSVAIVADNGKITAVSEGTAEITATSIQRGDFSKTITVTVGSLITPKQLYLSRNSTGNLYSYLTNVTFTSSNSSVASVTSSGTTATVNGKTQGTVTITASRADSDGVIRRSYCTVEVFPIEVGNYQIRNNYSGKYLDLFKSTNNYDYLKVETLDRAASGQVYNISFSPSTGYYTIKALSIDKVLGVTSNSTADGQYVDPAALSSTADGQKWRIRTSPNTGYYTVVAKTGEGSSPKGMSEVSGETNVYQKTISSAGTRAYWKFEKVYALEVDHYYDAGYLSRFNISGATAVSRIQGYQNTVSGYYYQVFGDGYSLPLRTYSKTAPSSFNSLRQRCTAIGHDTICTSNHNGYTGGCSSSSNMALHFKTNAPLPYSNTRTRSLWTGYLMGSSDYADASVAYGEDWNVIINSSRSTKDQTPAIRDNRSTSTLFHELAHQVGALDHYCMKDYDLDCTNPLCSDCKDGQGGRPRQCVMYQSVYITNVANKSNAFCSGCRADIKSHLDNHHK